MIEFALLVVLLCLAFLAGILVTLGRNKETTRGDYFMRCSGEFYDENRTLRKRVEYLEEAIRDGNEWLVREELEDRDGVLED